jgi:hypothetical protein
MIYAFHVLEGLARWLDALVVEQHRGITVVWLILVIHRKFSAKWAKLKRNLVLDPIYPDVVAESEEMEEIRIKTLAKKDWKQNQLVRYRDRFFILISEFDSIESGREVFRYRLRKADWWEIKEGAVEYSPM